MDLAELITEKEKAIRAFFKSHPEFLECIQGSSHASSLGDLRAAIKALDEPYQQEYEASYHSKNGMHNSSYIKIKFVDLLKDLPLTASDIAYILDYDRDEVGWMLSEPFNTYRLDETALKSYRDAYAIYKTNKNIGYIEGFVESFAEAFVEAGGDNTEGARLIAARHLLDEGYEARTISYATGIPVNTLERKGFSRLIGSR